MFVLPRSTVYYYTTQGICDGAGAVILASEEAVIKHGLKPLARVVCAYTAGVEPSIMGIGPAPAIRGVLKKSGYRLEDIDIIEVSLIIIIIIIKGLQWCLPNSNCSISKLF